MIKNIHQPVMSTEVVNHLVVARSGTYLDATCGFGGHTEVILKKLNSEGKLIAMDQDQDAINYVKGKFTDQSRLKIIKGRFGNLKELLESNDLNFKFSGILADLGISSFQLDNAHRGFSFQNEGPLDMRMDLDQSLTAANIVNCETEIKLADIIWRFGGERESRKIAKAIVRAREKCEIRTTKKLAEIVEGVKPRRGKKTHPATKVFQGLRIKVNDEFGELKQGLKSVSSLLKEGGRLVVITFHSGEDRIVKDFGRVETRDYDVPGEEDVPALRVDRPPRMRWANRKAICATEKELAVNPRARSAQLRVLEKLRT